jgi:hypothetical protein
VKQRILIRALELAHKVAQDVTDALALSLAFTIEERKPLRRVGNVIYLPRRR